MKSLFTLLLFIGIASTSFSQSRPIYFHVSKAYFKLSDSAKLSPPIECKDIFIINGTQKEILVLSETAKVYTIIDQNYKEANDGAVLHLKAKDRNNSIVNFFWVDIQKGNDYTHMLIMKDATNSSFLYEGKTKDVF